MSETTAMNKPVSSTRRNALQTLMAVGAVIALLQPDQIYAAEHDLADLKQILRQKIQARLTDELADAELAVVVAGYLDDVFFNWTLPKLAPSSIEAIFVYGFGGRTVPPGSKASALFDPVNAQIAEVASRLYHSRRVRIYAEQSVANLLIGRYGLGEENVRVIPAAVVTSGLMMMMHPPIMTLSDAMLKAADEDRVTGAVAIVTHRDQARSVVRALSGKKSNVGVVDGEQLPIAYDLQASSPLFQRRDWYLSAEITLQMGALRKALIEKYYP